MSDRKLPVRIPNRMKGYDYSSYGFYFVTVCTKDKTDLFWEPFVGAAISRPSEINDFNVCLSEYGKIVEEAINNISLHYSKVVVDKYCIMPNHVHLIVYLGNEENNGRIISAPTLPTIIGQMKRFVSKQCGFPVWQKSFHDHIIRNRFDYEKIAHYIEQNPIKWKADCYYIENPNL